jgi:uncharacterized protein (TIGR02594 family)
MAKFIAAQYEKSTLTVDYVADDGSHLLRSGGTIPWRFNNPGNIRPGTTNVESRIGIGLTSSGKFAIFASYEIGRSVLKNLLRTGKSYKDSTITEAMNSYAPPNENDTKKYIDFIVTQTGKSKDTKLSDLSDAQLEIFMNNIEKFEGYNGKKDTRKEKLVNTTGMTISDGTKSLPDQEVKIKFQDGKELTTKTNYNGKTPPIVHFEENKLIEVYLKNMKNEWEKIHEFLTGKVSKNFMIFKDVKKFSGKTELIKDKDSKKVKLESFSYIVQPGDTLHEIAKKFKTTPEKMQSGNSEIKDINLIYPGQKILIHGENRSETQRKISKALTQSNAKKPSEKNEKIAQPTIAVTSNEGTGKALALIDVNQNRAPWMIVAIEEARKWAGKDEKIITKTTNYHAEVKDGLKTLVGDKNPWCAAFINYCLKKSNPTYTMSQARASSQSFMHDKKNFIKIPSKIFGAIVVFTNKKDSSKGHVGFVYSEKTHLGGNQNDSINFNTTTDTKKMRLAGYYVPAAYYGFAMKEINDAGKLDSRSAMELNKLLGLKQSDGGSLI